MELLVQFVAAPVIGVIPFAISLLMCWFCNSWRRWLAVVLALISGSIFFFEVYSATVGGNLTGLIWMLSLPVVSIAVVVLYVMEKMSRNLRKSASHTASPSSNKGGNKVLPNGGLEAQGSNDRV